MNEKQLYKPYTLGPVDYWIAGIIFVIGLLLYGYTTSPGICAGDSGELTSAVFFLGNAHSPGYPLYCVVGKFFMNMLPFLGRAVYRLNMMSAILGAVTVAIIFMVMVKLLGRITNAQDETEQSSVAPHVWLLTRLPALAAAFFMMFNFEIWAQTTLSEVYTLNAVICPFLLLILLVWDEKVILKPEILETNDYYWNQASKMIYAFYFLLAFNLGNHHILLGYIVPTFFFIISRYVKGNSFKTLMIAGTIAYFITLFRIGNISIPSFFLVIAILTAALAPMFNKSKKVYIVLMIAGLFAGLGLLIYLYMPIRATAYTPLHWGVPNTWERFSNVVLRKQYAGFAQVSSLLDPVYRFEQLMVWLKWRFESFTWPVLLLVIPGLINLFKKDRRWFWFTLSFILYYDIGLLIFNNFRDTPRDKFFAEVFWIPSYLITAIWLAYGVQWLIVQAVKHCKKINLSAKNAAIAVLVIAFILAGLQGIHNFTPNNNHNNWENDNYGRNMMTTLDKNAILFTEGGDNQVFSMLYHHLVEHMRPDITVWDQKGNVFEGLYGDLMRITQNQLSENYITGDYSQWTTERPIYYTWKDFNRIEEINKRYYTSKGLPRRDFQTVGILYRIVPANVNYTQPIEYWDYYKFLWKDLTNQAVHWDYLAREIIANYNFQYGDRYLTMADEIRQAYNSGAQIHKGVLRKDMIAKIDEYETTGFQYYSDAARYGYDMVAIHFNNAIFIEQKAVQYIRERKNDKALELYTQAIERYKKAIIADKGEVRAYNNLAMVYEKKANLDWKNELTYLSNAKKVLEKALKINKGFDQAKNNLQRISGKIDFPVSKIEELQKKIDANPKDKASVDKLLDALLKRGEIDMADQFLRNIVKFYPNDWHYYQVLASINAQMQRPDQTIYFLEQMGRLQPANAGIWFNIAEIQYRMGQMANAARNYNKVLQFGPSNPQFASFVNQAQQRLVEIQNRR